MLKPLYRKRIAFFLVVAVLMGILAPPLTSAQTNPPAGQTQAANQGGSLFDQVKFTNCGGFNFDGLLCAIGWLLLGLGQIAIKISFLLIDVAVHVLDFMLKLNKVVLNTSVVQTGFRITLSTVNLFFVLVLILIAFATILRLEQYGAKKFLARFVIATVLVNFSFLFAGAFLDFSHVVADQYRSWVTPKNMLAAFEPQKLLNLNPNGGKITGYREKSTGALTEPPNIFNYASLGIFGAPAAYAIANNNYKSLATNPNYVPEYENGMGTYTIDADDNGQFGATVLKIFMAMLLSAALGTVIAIVLFTVGIMLALRFMWLTFLIIIMPFAWFFWTTPFYTEYASAWWKKFLEWVMFLPVVLFFIHLAIRLGIETSASSNTIGLKDLLAQSEAGGVERAFRDGDFSAFIAPEFGP
jgi:hypothetical protein